MSRKIRAADRAETLGKEGTLSSLDVDGRPQGLPSMPGKMIHSGKSAAMPGNVCCRFRYGARRMFCPRSIPSFWREVSLEGVEAASTPTTLARP
jgi:hypothetical protein